MTVYTEAAASIKVIATYLQPGEQIQFITLKATSQLRNAMHLFTWDILLDRLKVFDQFSGYI